jgi:hypothetical protein
MCDSGTSLSPAEMRWLGRHFRPRPGSRHDQFVFNLLLDHLQPLLCATSAFAIMDAIGLELPNTYFQCVQFASESAGKFGGALATMSKFRPPAATQQSGPGRLHPSDTRAGGLGAPTAGPLLEHRPNIGPSLLLTPTCPEGPLILRRMRRSENHHPLDDCDGSEDR